MHRVLSRVPTIALALREWVRTLFKRRYILTVRLPQKLPEEIAAFGTQSFTANVGRCVAHRVKGRMSILLVDPAPFSWGKVLIGLGEYGTLIACDPGKPVPTIYLRLNGRGIEGASCTLRVETFFHRLLRR